MIIMQHFYTCVMYAKLLLLDDEISNASMSKKFMHDTSKLALLLSIVNGGLDQLAYEHPVIRASEKKELHV